MQVLFRRYTCELLSSTSFNSLKSILPAHQFIMRRYQAQNNRNTPNQGNGNRHIQTFHSGFIAIEDPENDVNSSEDDDQSYGSVRHNVVSINAPVYSLGGIYVDNWGGESSEDEVYRYFREESSEEEEPPSVPIPTIKTFSNHNFQHSVKLHHLIPSLHKPYFNSNKLHRLTHAKFDELATYFKELSISARHHPKLSNNNNLINFQNILKTVNNQHNALISVDIEAFERNNNLVTEIGLSIYDPSKQAGSILPTFNNIHIIIKENEKLRNGRFVTDNRFNFLGGNSIVLELHQARKFIQTVIDYYFIHRQEIGMTAAIVGHSVAGDVKWLKKIGVKFPENCLFADSQTLYTIVNGSNNSSLGAILRRFDIPHSYLHNAGNDAYYTLLLLMKLSDPYFRKFHKLDDYSANLKYLENLNAPRNKQRLQNVQNKIPKPIKSGKIYEVAPTVEIRDYKEALLSSF